MVNAKVIEAANNTSQKVYSFGLEGDVTFAFEIF
jgi:hypothetical protein